MEKKDQERGMEGAVIVWEAKEDDRKEDAVLFQIIPQHSLLSATLPQPSPPS
jgi:hypothetical protein